MEGESGRRGVHGVGRGPGGWLVVGSFYRANSGYVTKSSHQDVHRMVEKPRRWPVSAEPHVGRREGSGHWLIAKD